MSRKKRIEDLSGKKVGIFTDKAGVVVLALALLSVLCWFSYEYSVKERYTVVSVEPLDFQFNSFYKCAGDSLQIKISALSDTSSEFRRFRSLQEHLYICDSIFQIKVIRFNQKISKTQQDSIDISESGKYYKQEILKMANELSISLPICK